MSFRSSKYMLLLLIVFSFSSLTFAQKRDRFSEFQQIGLPKFSLNAINLRSEIPGKTKVIVYVEIPYYNLQFVKAGDLYKATYEVDLSVLLGEQEDGPRVDSKLWKSTVEVETFEETNSKIRFDISETEFNIDPTIYTILANLTDKDTKRNVIKSTSLIVPQFGLKDLELSDPIIAKQIHVAEDGAYEIEPNVDRTIMNSQEPIFVFYEIYSDSSEMVNLYTRIVNQNGDIVREISDKRYVTPTVTRHYQMINISDLSVGHYVLEMMGQNNTTTALRGSSFRIHISGLPSSVADLESAIRQLRYIARSKTIKEILGAAPMAQEPMFKKFWSNRDPDPSTPENELMLEYYSRIERTNVFFGGFRDGWETDRGEVYIRFGAPSEIERQAYNTNNKAYEVWYYYPSNKKYIFVDEMGFGEYRLVSELWQ
jgi:GWxTD domain-containing protein